MARAARLEGGGGIKRISAQAAADLGYNLVGGALYATGIEIFARGANFAPGGVSGIGLILNYLWGLPIGLTTLILNLPLVALSYRFVGRRFLVKTVGSVLTCTVLLDVVFSRFPSYTGSPLLSALFYGVFLGAGLAVFYMRGASSGGTDLLTMSIKVKRPHLSLGFVTMSIDIAIILLGWPVFGDVDAVLYGLVATTAASLMIDRIMYGIGASKLVIIITARGGDVAGRIGTECNRGSTVIQAAGSYTGLGRQVLLCACSKAEAFKVRSAAHAVDTGAFVMITETSEVFGEGFSDPSQPTSFL